jgi:hypothetical protein
MNPSAISLLSLLLVTASASLPSFVVPNFPDLTIKVRRTTGDWSSAVETLYLKGTRQRTEFLSERLASVPSVDITQCDTRRRYILDQKWKTYDYIEIEDWQQRAKRASPIPQLQLSGASVDVSIDSVDTGERRKMGSYEARRVKTTTKVAPEPGAVTPASLTEADGWYIDLPGYGCEDSRNSAAWLVAWSGKRDRVVMKRLGKAPRGYAVEETSRKTESARTTVTKVELLEFSEAPLDASLFEVPADYRLALHTPNGGHDMSKPDTFTNRMQVYWDYWTASVRRWLRLG